MTCETNITLAQRYRSAWAHNDQELIDELCAVDIRVTYSLAPAPLHGRDALKSMVAGVHKTFPGLEIETRQIIADGEFVALRWVMRGTHNGRRAAWPGHNMLRVRDGVIVKDFGVDDGLGMLRQLGVREVPGSGL